MKTANPFASAANTVPPASPVDTELSFSRIQDGLALQMVDMHREAPQTSRITLPESLSLSILLQGQVGLQWSRTGLLALSAPGRRSVAQAALFHAPEPIEIKRELHANTRLRHLAILATPDWLERSGFTAYGPATRLMRGPPRSRVLPKAPCAPAITLSERLLRHGHEPSALARLHRESLVLALLAHALQAQTDAPALPLSLNARALRRLYQVRDKLDCELAQTPSIEGISREFGMSADTLQRQFQAAFGTTVFGYLYEARMQCALHALEAGSPVSLAAYAVGYNNPANFSTAFKRRFGITPKQARRTF